jgi:NADH-quinone oxidoreductase subunit K
LILALVMLVIGSLMLVSSRDLVRLLISLEFLFASLFLSILGIMNSPQGYETLVAIIFTSSSELMILVAVITIFSRMFKTTSLEGDKVD